MIQQSCHFVTSLRLGKVFKGCKLNITFTFLQSRTNFWVITCLFWCNYLFSLVITAWWGAGLGTRKACWGGGVTITRVELDSTWVCVVLVYDSLHDSPWDKHLLLIIVSRLTTECTESCWVLIHRLLCLCRHHRHSRHRPTILHLDSRAPLPARDGRLN